MLNYNKVWYKDFERYEEQAREQEDKVVWLCGEFVECYLIFSFLIYLKKNINTIFSFKFLMKWSFRKISLSATLFWAAFFMSKSNFFSFTLFDYTVKCLV